MKENYFLAIEGLDGVGKTTVSSNLASRNGGGLYAADIREFPGAMLTTKSLSLHFFYYLWNNYLIGEAIDKSDGLSVADGHVLRTVTSHEALGLNLALPAIATPLMRMIKRPDLTIFLTCDHDERIKRLQTRIKSMDQYEIINVDVETRAVSGYEQWSKKLGHDLKPVETNRMAVDDSVALIEQIVSRESIRKRIMKEVILHHKEYQHIISRCSSVLDVGTGTGFTAEYLQSAHNNLDITGLDIKSYKTYPDRIPRKLYDGTVIPFRDDEFEVSLLFYTLHHADSPELLLREVTRITQRYVIIIEEFDHNDSDSRIEELKEQSTLAALGLEALSGRNNLGKQQLEKMLAENGLKIHKFMRLPTSTARTVDKCLYIVEIN